MTSWNVARSGSRATLAARIVLDVAERTAALARALAGPGAPAGVVAYACEPGVVTIEVDANRTPFELILAIVETLTASNGCDAAAYDGAAGDERLTKVCAARLGEPDLDTSRLIETYLEPMLIESP